MNKLSFEDIQKIELVNANGALKLQLPDGTVLKDDDVQVLRTWALLQIATKPYLTVDVMRR